MITLSESVQIDSSPQELFNWFRNLDKNYTKWHPDHIKWVFEGSFEEGSRCRYEETLHGSLHRARAKLIRVDEDKLIEFKHFFPTSIVCPGGSFIIERRGSRSLFIATLDFRAGWLFSMIAGRRVDAVRRHMKEESQSLKRIMERTAQEEPMRRTASR